MVNYKTTSRCEINLKKNEIYRRLYLKKLYLPLLLRKNKKRSFSNRSCSRNRPKNVPAAVKSIQMSLVKKETSSALI